MRLQVGTEINQDVPAGEDIEPGKGRIHRNVARCEHHHLAYFLADPETAILFNEKPRQTLQGNLTGNAGRIGSQPCLGDGVRIEVGGKNLQVEPVGGSARSVASQKIMASV